MKEWFRNLLRFEFHEHHSHYYQETNLTEEIIKQYTEINHKMNAIMAENKSLKLMYEDLQQDVQPLQRVVEQLRSV